MARLLNNAQLAAVQNRLAEADSRQIRLTPYRRICLELRDGTPIVYESTDETGYAMNMAGPFVEIFHLREGLHVAKIDQFHHEVIASTHREV